jgi:hypothetical protein
MFASLGFASSLPAEGDQSPRLQVCRSQPLGGFPIGQGIVHPAIFVVLKPTLDKLSDLQRYVLGHGNLDP